MKRVRRNVGLLTISIFLALSAAYLCKNHSSNKLNKVEDKLDVVIIKSHGKAYNLKTEENAGDGKIQAPIAADESGIQPIPNAHSPIIMVLLSSEKNK